jgi:DNA polymerase III subunit epsilon
VVAHNASFDMSVLRYVLNVYGIDYPNLKYACTWMMSKKTWPGLISYKLDYISRQLGVGFKHHNALEDAYACSEIARASYKLNSASSFDDLLVKLGISCGRLYTNGYIPSSIKGEGRFNYVKAGEITAATGDFDENNPLYQKTVIFTGTLQSMLRKEAMQKVVNAGGFCSDNINKDTNYLVVGMQDYKSFSEGQKSSKLKKAEQLISKGYGIELINEDDFLSMI